MKGRTENGRRRFMEEKLLTKETAVVTGAAFGIGRGIAIAIAREGARVLLCDIDAVRGEETAASLRREGCDTVFMEADLAAPDGAERLLNDSLVKFGTPSLFVHSASPRRLEADNVLDVSADTWDRMLSVNVRSGFFLAREIGRRMMADAVRGRMLFVTSLHAQTPRNLPHYSAAKAGQTMVVRELAKALGPHGIRVNAIAPGAVPGGGFDAQGAGVERLTRCTSLRRLGTPEEIAGMALALLVDRFSAYVTGTTVVVDGGMSLHNWMEPPEL
ncbi:MAG TPA: SDR family oxidoreductase [Burkholderiales bacterium]|nr:SDR family oxidoreductase [Burkholderiales bacterium]